MENQSEPQIVEVDWSVRWQVYHRLKALEIECSCKMERPLRVYSNNPQAAIQVWSVTKQITSSRQELIDWIDRCWQIKSYK